MRDLYKILARTVSGKTSEEIEEIMNNLPADNEDAIEAFCEGMELGNFMSEALLIGNIDISDALDNIRLEHQLDEEAAREERYERESELKSAVGW